MRASFASASSRFSFKRASGAGSKPPKASSKPSHLFSITRQTKPAQNTARVISAR